MATYHVEVTLEDGTNESFETDIPNEYDTFEIDDCIRHEANEDYGSNYIDDIDYWQIGDD
jgi:hypothetical protein